MARVAHTWHLDIVEVARDPSVTNRQLRVAGHNVIQRDLRESSEAAQRAREARERGR